MLDSGDMAAERYSGLLTVMLLRAANSDNPSTAWTWYLTHILGRGEESSKVQCHA